MNSNLIEFYKDCFKGKEQGDVLYNFFSSSSAQKADDIPNVDFSINELSLLAEFLPSEEPVYMRNFLSFMLVHKKYSALITFFGKLFVSHIGKVVFASRNQKDFDITERNFDRFMESIIFANLPFAKWSDFLLAILGSNNTSILHKWYRPTRDYLLDLCQKDEKKFYKFAYDNFSSYGMLIFEFLIDNSVPSAINELIKLYLYHSFKEERQVKNILKQHYAEVKEYLNQQQKNGNLSVEIVIKLLLLFKNQKEVVSALQNIYYHEKDKGLKKLIAVNVRLSASNKPNFAQFKKNAQRFDEKECCFDVSSLPELIFYNNEKASVQVVKYIINLYQNLCSTNACFENNYLKSFFEPKSLNNFCLELSSQIIKPQKDDKKDWIFCLVAQNIAPNGALTVLLKMIENKKNSSQNIDKFVRIFVKEQKAESLELFKELNPLEFEHRLILNALLKGFIETEELTPMEIEALKDKMVPYFSLKDSALDVDNCTIVIKPNFEVEIQPSGAEITKNALVEKKKLEREIIRQSKRLENAMISGRLWSKQDFDDFILKNPLMNFLARKLLWGKYVENALISVFKIEDNGFVNLMSVQSDKTTNYQIGIFHPVEFSEPDWTYMFNGRQSPFNQLYIDVFPKSKFDAYSSVVSRFNGFFVNSQTFFERMEKFGWRYARPTMNGYFSSLQKINNDLQLLAELDFSSKAYQNMHDGSTSLEELRFYRLDDVIKTGNNFITNKKNALDIGSVNERFFSTVLYEITNAGKK